MIRDFVGQPEIMRHLTRGLALKLLDDGVNFDFIAGNANEAMVPGWQLRNDLQHLTGDQVPFAYVREERKKGGHKERITGDESPMIEKGDRALVVETDDVNFLPKVLSSAEALRGRGYQVDSVATILSPDDQVRNTLSRNGLTLISYLNAEQLNALLERKIDELPLERPEFSDEIMLPEEITRMIINAGALEIRDLAGGEEPFLYSSGLWGPGYAMIKGLVGQPDVFNQLVWQLALKLADRGDIDFIIGNVTGGVIPGWQLRNNLEVLQGREVPYVYAEGTRLLDSGLVEGRIVGDKNNPLIRRGDRGLVVEELVNTAGTTTGSAIHARERGYQVGSAATIFNYVNPIALQRLQEYGLDLTHLITLSEVLDVAERERLFEPRAVQDYRSFIQDPRGYLEKWELIPVDRGGTK